MTRPNCLAPDACVAKTPGKHCRSCNIRLISSDPAMAAAKLAGIQARWDRPGERERHGNLMRKISKRLWADPAVAERWREKGKRLAHKTVLGEKCQAATRTPETNAKRGEANRRRPLSWCPANYLSLNRKLYRLGYGLEDRKRMIADQVAADARAERKKIQEFHREQVERAAREKRQAY